MNQPKEVNVDSSVAVAEAAAALTAQGVQAIWVGGDNTVLRTGFGHRGGAQGSNPGFFCCPKNPTGEPSSISGPTFTTPAE